MIDMTELTIGGLPLMQVLLSLFVFLVFIGFAWFFHVFLIRTAHKLARKLQTGFTNAVVSTLDKPGIVIIIFIGLYISVRLLPLETAPQSYLTRILGAILGLLGIYAGTSLIYALARWYRREALAHKETALTRLLLSVFQALTALTAIFLAVLVVLANLGFSVAPVTGWLAEHGWRIALIVAISMVAIVAAGHFIPVLVVASLARRAGEAEEEVKKRAETLSRVLANAGQIIVLIAAVFMVLAELEIQIAPILAGFGVAGIAIGFGAQSLVKDLLAGLFIIMENQYRVGDVVKIADVAGLVEDVNLRRTILRDLDGIVHIVPNGEIRVASNFTKDWSRVNLNVSVAYGENLDRVISVINRVGDEITKDPQWAPLILKAPQVLRVDNLGVSGVDIKILGDTKPIRQWDVMGELRRRLKKAFDEEGIEIALPRTKVYFGNPPPYSESNQSETEKKNK